MRVVAATGEIHYFDESGRLHREDGPAVEMPDGHKSWWKHGVCHRLDGPAIIQSNGNQYWYVEGRLHNDKGPSVIQISGKKWYYLYGQEISEKKFYNMLKMNEAKAMLGIK